MITPQNEEQYLELTVDQRYLVSADFTKMNAVQQEYIKVRVGGKYGDLVFATMFKRGKPDNLDDIRDFFAIGYELDEDGDSVATGITDYPDVTFYPKQSAQAWVKQYNLDNPSLEDGS